MKPGCRMIWIRRNSGGKNQVPKLIPVTVITVRKYATVRVEETGSIRNVDPDNLEVPNENLEARIYKR